MFFFHMDLRFTWVSLKFDLGWQELMFSCFCVSHLVCYKWSVCKNVTHWNAIKSNFTNLIQMFNGTPANLRSIFKNIHPTKVNIEWVRAHFLKKWNFLKKIYLRKYDFLETMGLSFLNIHLFCVGVLCFFCIDIRFTGVPLKYWIGLVKLYFLAFLCETLGC